MFFLSPNKDESTFQINIENYIIKYNVLGKIKLNCFKKLGYGYYYSVGSTFFKYKNYK